MIFVARHGIIASTFPSAVVSQDFNAVLAEDGGYILQQDSSSKILIESGSAATNFDLYSSYGILTIASDSSSSSQSSYGGLIFIE